MHLMGSSCLIVLCLQSVPGQVLEAVLHAQDAIQLLVIGKDYASAVEVLENLKYQCDQQGLYRLHCLQHLPDSLSRLTNSLISSLEDDFEAAVQWKLSGSVVEEAVQKVLQERGVEEMCSMCCVVGHTAGSCYLQWQMDQFLSTE